jgi:hypothetical protein
MWLIRPRPGLIVGFRVPDSVVRTLPARSVVAIAVDDSNVEVAVTSAGRVIAESYHVRLYAKVYNTDAVSEDTLITRRHCQNDLENFPTC